MVTLTCSSLDGSPQPKLAWFKGDNQRELSNAVASQQPYAQSNLQITVTREDNEGEYRQVKTKIDKIPRWIENSAILVPAWQGQKFSIPHQKMGKASKKFHSIPTTHS